MERKTLATVAIVTVALALFASATIASYNDVSAKKYNGDSNAQTSAANNDCPAEVALLAQIAVQIQTSANCLNDANMVQDSDGTAIASTPANAAPSQTIEIGLELGDLGGIIR